MGGVQLQEVSANGWCPVTRGVCYWEVSSYRRCLLMGGVQLQEVSANGRCPVTAGVC